MPIFIFCIALIFSTASKSQDEGSSAAVDLSAPSLAAPQLEDAPNAGSILSSLTNLVPQISGFQMPQHQSVCYAPQFDFVVRSFTMDLHCQLIEPHRNLIGLVALLMWSLSAFFIIMGA